MPVVLAAEKRAASSVGGGRQVTGMQGVDAEDQGLTTLLCIAAAKQFQTAAPPPYWRSQHNVRQVSLRHGLAATKAAEDSDVAPLP